MKKETQKKKWTKKTKERGERLKNNSYGITLIALVIAIIVLLILARNFDFDAKSEIIRFLTKQDKQEI